jgi:hypothetical protein
MSKFLSSEDESRRNDKSIAHRYKSSRRYQTQCFILESSDWKRHMSWERRQKAFWEWVRWDTESWESHHENEKTLENAFSILSKIIKSTSQARSTYDEASRRIDELWESSEKSFARLTQTLVHDYIFGSHHAFSSQMFFRPVNRIDAVHRAKTFE